MGTRLNLFLAAAIAAGLATAMQPAAAATLSATPPMGWNDWAHYQCDYTAQTVLANAKALVASGLAKAGYDRVTIDDCWMGRKRAADGNLQANPKRFPHGIAPVAAEIHKLGLRFGIYEDAGSETCGGYAGSGWAKGGTDAHFKADMRLFAKWGVDYVKLDGCNVQVPKGGSVLAAYRKAYAEASAAIKASGRPMEFLESAPAYFQGQPDWYDVLGWVGQYGQLWREGSDIATFNRKHPDTPRFHSVLWNYAYNLPLGRYQKPGNWNDPDFIIGGDRGMTLAETRSQVALWSMMSAPLILSLDVAKLTPAAVKVIGNAAVIRVDQDPEGRMATLVRRTPKEDVLFKPLAGGDYAVAVLNRSAAPIDASVTLPSLGFAPAAACTVSADDLWTGATAGDQHDLHAQVQAHDTAIWRIHPAAACGVPTRTGAIVMTMHAQYRVPSSRNVENYGRCLAGSGVVQRCEGTPNEAWTVGAGGSLRTGNQCLAAVDGKPQLQPCADEPTQHWKYRLNGNLVNASDALCLSAEGPDGKALPWTLKACGANEGAQIWALPD
ncbi:MAG TPA: ricin-type beta-trefoil lectin domain protein [Rhodanobacteraceae bacterium]